jgi:glycosyltransferase involved in cell wall biosynthesis
LPNVHRLGWRTQAELGQYNAAFDVCLIPYRTDHPFNRVSCPTKVMDYMATSRPVVTTPLPECQLYQHLFEVAESPDEFIAAVRRVVEKGSDDGRATLRWEVARAATWERTSEAMLKRLREATAGRL